MPHDFRNVFKLRRRKRRTKFPSPNVSMSDATPNVRLSDAKPKVRMPK